MNTPNSQMNSPCLKRLTPGEHVLINTIDECAVEIEKKRRECSGGLVTLGFAFCHWNILLQSKSSSASDQTLTFISKRCQGGRTRPTEPPQLHTRKLFCRSASVLGRPRPTEPTRGPLARL